MTTDICEVQIKQVKGHWEVRINGRFFCSADSYTEAVKELNKAYKY